MITPSHPQHGARPLAFAAVCALAAFALASLGAPRAAQAQDALMQAQEAITAWQIPEAKALLERAESDPKVNRAEWMVQQGRLAFYSGNYQEALDRIDQATAINPGGKLRYEPLRARVADTHDVVKDYKSFTSPNGYFTIRVEAGKDEVLIPYAFETLEAAYVELGEVFGHTPPPPVIVEIYPKAATLAKVSGLTEEEIKTSGTIALCSYNRLMFTSPKALVRGYGWRDTLTHEYAHLVITQRSRNTVPIWMHEGLAKYHERRWRGTKDASHLMSPSSENLLAKATAKDELITFEQMHPSMAKLPSQEATALAFAEVYTVMEYIHREKGTQAFADLLTGMRAKGDDTKAIADLMGVPFKTFQSQWETYLKSRPSKAFDEEVVYVEKLAFADESNPSELLEIGKKEARDYIHLGELLQARERYGAAVREYQKARALIGDHNPILQTRLGRSLMTLGRYDEAVDVLAKSLDYYPTYYVSHILLGESLLKLDRYAEAETHLMEALGINPFDPKVHTLLAQLYDKTKRPDLAIRAREHARKVS